MPSPEQSPHWVSRDVWPPRAGHHSPVPLTFHHGGQIRASGLLSGSSSSSTGVVHSADTGFISSVLLRPNGARRFRWDISHLFRRPVRQTPDLSGTAERSASQPWPIPIWELESHFLRIFDVYEDTLLRALATRIGPVAERLDLRGRIQFSEDMGLLSEAAKTIWADCLAVRLRVLLGDRDLPGRDEVAWASHAMNALVSDLVAVVLTMKINSQGGEPR